MERGWVRATAVRRSYVWRTSRGNVPPPFTSLRPSWAQPRKVGIEISNPLPPAPAIIRSPFGGNSFGTSIPSFIGILNFNTRGSVSSRGRRVGGTVFPPVEWSWESTRGHQAFESWLEAWRAWGALVGHAAHQECAHHARNVLLPTARGGGISW